MPSLRKKVRGILRQISLTGNSVANCEQGGEEEEESSRVGAPFAAVVVNAPDRSLRHDWPVQGVTLDNHHQFLPAYTDWVRVTHAAGRNGYRPVVLTHNRGHSFHYRDDYYRPQSLFNPFGPLSARENGPGMNASFIHMYLTGRLKKRAHPEIYYGKTGVDLPVLQIVPLDSRIYASHSGPDGGLTRVSCVNKRPIVKIANLDDELKLSLDGGMDSVTGCSSLATNSSPASLLSSLYGLERDVKYGFPQMAPSSSTECDWNSPHDRACGLSTSLYETHPVTGIRAGDPVADVFGICSRSNSCVMALADGVNWGERSRLAARCAVRGALDNLTSALYSDQTDISNTADVFRCLLRAFHAGHQLILQEGGALTTLCVLVVCQLNDCPQWVVCSCNVGDSLAFVYSEKHGVREVTLGSHDIEQMRDMRDAGGALGPVDGVNPELHNMTCSMTIVDENDWIFLTSDGVSDNFDPVVGKFCVIREHFESQNGPCGSDQLRLMLKNSATQSDQNRQDKMEKGTMPKSGLTCLKSPIPARRADSAMVTASGRKAYSLRVESTAKSGQGKSQLPLVEAYQRHELMLLRMEYVIRRRISKPTTPSRNARDLCEALLNFVIELTSEKRSLLEDPDTYRCENTTAAQKEYKHRKRFIRHRVAAMPGKLDHATVVAQRIGVDSGHPDTDSLASSDDATDTTTVTMVEGIKASSTRALEKSHDDSSHRPVPSVSDPTTIPAWGLRKEKGTKDNFVPGECRTEPSPFASTLCCENSIGNPDAGSSGVTLVPTDSDGPASGERRGTSNFPNLCQDGSDDEIAAMGRNEAVGAPIENKEWRISIRLNSSNVARIPPKCVIDELEDKMGESETVRLESTGTCDTSSLSTSNCPQQTSSLSHLPVNSTLPSQTATPAGTSHISGDTDGQSVWMEKERAPGSGRFGKLSQAFDRMKRKHKRGSPSRHTVAVDRCHLVETKEANGNGRTSPTYTGNDTKTDDETFNSIPSTFSTPRRVPRFTWSPFRALRSWATLRSDRRSKRSKGNQASRCNGSKEAREAASVSMNNERSIVMVPHSASDTHIVQLAN